MFINEFTVVLVCSYRSFPFFLQGLAHPISPGTGGVAGAPGALGGGLRMPHRY